MFSFGEISLLASYFSDSYGREPGQSKREQRAFLENPDVSVSVTTQVIAWLKSS